MTQRQEKILYRAIEQYINTGEPVSSAALQGMPGFDISPATLRSEMNSLEEEGFLQQPHISSGRIPTDKAYRLYVNKIVLEKNLKGGKEKSDGAAKKFAKQAAPALESGDEFRMVRELARTLSDYTSSLAMAYFQDEGLLLKEGWDEIARLQEFERNRTMRSFAEMVENFEQEMRDFDEEFTRTHNEILLRIGRELECDKSGEFSVMAFECRTPKNKKKISVALLGPKRMPYRRNINLLKSAKKIMENKNYG